MQLVKTISSACLMITALGLNLPVQAEALAEAQVEIKIPLTKKPSSRPMTVAFIPQYQHYYIADGGLAPMGSDTEAPTSKSEIHVFDVNGKYLQSARPGYDNRVIYFNQKTYQLETITYNVSSGAGFSPNTGIFALDLNDQGELLETSRDVFGFNPAFGDAATMPTYNSELNVYYAKQERSNQVWIVDLSKREKVGLIELDFKSAGVNHDDVSDHYVAYTGITGEELAMVDVDHKAILIFNLQGKFIGRSMLPPSMKLRAQNHYNGLGFANGLMFIYHEPEGEFGTYYGFKFSSLGR